MTQFKLDDKLARIFVQDPENTVLFQIKGHENPIGINKSILLKHSVVFQDMEQLSSKIRWKESPSKTIFDTDFDLFEEFLAFVKVLHEIHTIFPLTEEDAGDSGKYFPHGLNLQAIYHFASEDIVVNLVRGCCELEPND